MNNKTKNTITAFSFKCIIYLEQTNSLKMLVFLLKLLFTYLLEYLLEQETVGWLQYDPNNTRTSAPCLLVE